MPIKVTYGGQTDEMSISGSYYCEWTRDEGTKWDSGCGESWVFTDGTPKGNGMQYCPFCGR